MRRPFIINIMILSLLTACSTLPQQEINTQTNSAACCTQLTELPMTLLSVPSYEKVAMDTHLPLLPLAALNGTNNTERVPVLTYRLASTQPLSLMIRSYITQSSLFAPELRVYDHDWRLIKRYSSVQFDYKPTGLQGLERIEAVIDINPQQNNTTYLLITADSQALAHTIIRQHPQTIYAQSQQIIEQKQLPLTAAFSSFGHIELTTSSPQNSEFLSLVSELKSVTTSQKSPISVSKHSDHLLWPEYKKKIDEALKNDNVKQAAAIANQASGAGVKQAKDYLLNQLAQ